MDAVIIRVGPHKASATIEVRDRREVLRATGRFGMDKAGYRQLLGQAAFDDVRAFLKNGGWATPR